MSKRIGMTSQDATPRFDPAPRADEPGVLVSLPRRELEILTLLIRRYVTKEIATTLFNSPRTVSSHVEAILRKLAVRNRHDAAVMATWHGLVAMPSWLRKTP